MTPDDSEGDPGSSEIPEVRRFQRVRQTSRSARCNLLFFYFYFRNLPYRWSNTTHFRQHSADRSRSWLLRPTHRKPRSQRSAPLTSSRAPFCSLELLGAPWTPRPAHFEPRALCSLELLGDPWTPRAAHFEPRTLCSLELLGAPLDAARRSLRAARSVQPQAAWRPLGRCAPLTSSRAPFAASSCSAPSWTPSAAHFEPRALCSLKLLGVPLDAARRSL